MLAFKTGHTEDGIRLVRESLEAAPGMADWHSNLGIMLQATDDVAGAIEAFRTRRGTRARSTPTRTTTWACCCDCCGCTRTRRPSTARRSPSTPIMPMRTTTWRSCWMLTGRSAEAVTAYCHALTLRPQFASARRQLAIAYCRIGEREKAIRMCEEWVRLEPDSEEGRHTLAAVSGCDVPARASDAYVSQTFDEFASHVRVQADAAALSRAGAGGGGAHRGGVAASRSRSTCSTWAAAPAGADPLVSPWARSAGRRGSLAGMLAAARSKGVYDELVHGELTAYLTARPATVRPDRRRRHAHLLRRPGAGDDRGGRGAPPGRPVRVHARGGRRAGAAGRSYRLEPHGRYVHRREYVERLLAPERGGAVIERADLRHEGGLPVAGLVVRAVKRRIGDGNA